MLALLAGVAGSITRAQPPRGTVTWIVIRPCICLHASVCSRDSHARHAVEGQYARRRRPSADRADVMPNYLKLIPQWISAVIRGTPRGPTRRTSTTPFLVIGHRGAPCVEVENTLASLRRAVEQDGANGLEVDLCLTKDQQIVLWHDWDPDAPIARLREAGLEPVVGYCPCPPDGGRFRWPICELSLDEFCAHFCYSKKDGNQQYRDCIPRLEELLDWVVGRREVAALFFDMKVPATRIDL